MKPEDIAAIISDAEKQYINEVNGEAEVEFVEPIHMIETKNIDNFTYFEILVRKYKEIKDEIKKIILKIFRRNTLKNNIRKDATVKPITDNGVPEGYTQMTD